MLSPDNTIVKSLIKTQPNFRNHHIIPEIKMFIIIMKREKKLKSHIGSLMYYKDSSLLTQGINMTLAEDLKSEFVY